MKAFATNRSNGDLVRLTSGRLVLLASLAALGALATKLVVSAPSDLLVIAR